MCHFFSSFTHLIEEGSRRCVFTYVRLEKNQLLTGPVRYRVVFVYRIIILIVHSLLPSLGSPSERYISQIALRPHVRPVYLRPPLPTLKRKLFWVLPIHRSLVPSSPGPCASFRIVGLSLLYPISQHVSTCPFCQFFKLYANTFSPPPNQVFPTPHEVRPLSSPPYVPFHIPLLIRARAYYPSLYILDIHLGTLSLRPPMARQLSIVSLTLPLPSPSQAHPYVGHAYSVRPLPLLSSQ